MSALSASVFYLHPSDQSVQPLLDFLNRQSHLADDSPLEIQVLDHRDGDYVVVVAPHLTDEAISIALNDWVEGWWDDVDEADYQTVENYLSQFSRRGPVSPQEDTD